MRLKKDPAPFKVGDRVTSGYSNFGRSKHVVRRVTKIKRDATFGSGFVASADDGGCCETCRRPFAEPIVSIDAAWFTKVKKKGSQP